MPRLVGWLPQARWKRWLLLCVLVCVLGFLGLLTFVFTGFLLWQNPKVQGWVMLTSLRHQVNQPVDWPPEPRLSDQESRLLLSHLRESITPDELFLPTNVWDIHLKFGSNQWTQLGPTSVPPVFHFVQPDGSVILRNPQATRNGLAGVFGLDFPWSSSDLQFGDVHFSKVGARFKGNGTFVGSQRTYKRPFKVELNKYSKKQHLAGIKTLNLHNLTADASCLSDTLGYEFFREAGVPAPRTSFARVRLSIDGRFENRLLGLYVMVENPDAQWARAQFGVDGVALFKPVTYELFDDLGEDWKAYEGIYDPKTKLEPGQTSRIIGLAKLASHGSDKEFSERIGDFIDLDEFARFLACQVILANYDGFLSNGQNFLLYLEPRTKRFGFIPWDLDQCWGKFGYIGTIRQREQASLWHPWVGENRFLERMLRVSAVQAAYRRELERLLATLFVPERLGRRMDELALIARPFVAEESPRRLARFEREVAAEVSDVTNPGKTNSTPRGFCFRRFFKARAASVTAQLDGRSQGVILTRGRGR